MRGFRIGIALALAALGVCSARADGVDPTVVIRRVDPTPLPITSPTETFPIVATSVFNVFAFQNDTGVTLTSLSLDLFAGLSGLTYSCGSFAGGGIFSTCSSTPGSNHDTLIKFFGTGPGFPGITPATCSGDGDGDGDGDFDFDDLSGCSGGIYSLVFTGIPVGAVVMGTGTVATPEPMSAVLLLGGLAGLAGFRKRRAS